MTKTKTIFDKIIDGEIPAYKIWEDEKYLAFLDIAPIQPGQTLVIPKKPFEYIFDMDDDEYVDLMKVSKKIAQILKKALNPDKIGMIVEGLEIPHVHVKLVPISLDKHFGISTKLASPSELSTMQDRLLSILHDL